MAESESDIRIATDNPYHALMGELWGVYCEDVGEVDRVRTALPCISTARWIGILIQVTKYLTAFATSVQICNQSSKYFIPQNAFELS